MKKWAVKTIDADKSAALQKALEINGFAADLMTARGITDINAGENFLKGNALSDPYMMRDMDAAVKCIREHISTGARIAVYGDYDCDGITSAYMLYNYLDMVGADVIWYIPTRSEGYGLNKDAADKLKKMGTELIVTVDNGISALQEAIYIYECGMKLVVTDHHRPGDVLPQCEAVVDPHRKDDTSPFKPLAGAGVVLKLIIALENGDVGGVMEQFSDIAAIGTIGDIVPLVGENRHIVSVGLHYLQFTENIGLSHLNGVVNTADNYITSEMVAYGLVPRLNAAGRISHPGIAMELLLSENHDTASNLTQQLSILNSQRQKCVEEIIESINENFKSDAGILNRKVIIASGEGFNHGVVGIACSKLTQTYDKPGMVIGISGDVATGSSRSIDGFSVYDAISSCSDLLIRFGGHTKAAGFSLKTENIPEFTERIQKFADENYPVMPVTLIEADMEIPFKYMNVSDIDYIYEKFAPFGEGNNTPLFLLRNCKILSKRPLKNGRFTGFTINYGGNPYNALCFGVKYSDFYWDVNTDVDIMANIEINEYGGKTTLSVKVNDIRPSSFNQKKFFAAKSVYDDILSGGRFDDKLKNRIIPAKEDIRLVYDLLRKYSLDYIILNCLGEINYCKLMLSVQILEEMKLVNIDKVSGRSDFLPYKGKINLSESKILTELTEKGHI